MSKLLVIDDDRTVRRLVEKSFEPADLTVLAAENAESGMESLNAQHPDVVLLDIMLPDKSGIELVKEIKAFDARLPVIFITGSNDSDVAIEAMKLGAYEYLLKPLDMQHVQDLVEKALDARRLMQSPVHLDRAESTAQKGDVLVGRSTQMHEVYKQIGRVAAEDVTVIIRGESGTGKELIARAIYQHSHRKQECFLAVNCAALSDTLLESELFGHEKGAFTGADRRHIGKFEQCNNGTIFLDEIGDMSPATQSKVLRLLQEQKFERVGGRETIEVDVRMISATNRDLEQMIEDGEFRLDLFHRLNAFEIELPPLRERGQDLELLIEHFLSIFNHQLSKQVGGISPEALQILKDYAWPGNVRELQGTLRKSMLMATGPVIVPECLPKSVSVEENSESEESPPSERLRQGDLQRFVDDRSQQGSIDLYAETLEIMERYLLTRVLREESGNQSRAAERLGITRGSLRYKIRALQISIEQVVSSDAIESSSIDQDDDDQAGGEVGSNCDC